MESLLEVVDLVPGGLWTVGAAALLLVPGVRQQLRPLARAGLRAGLAAVDQGRRAATAVQQEYAAAAAEHHSREAPASPTLEA